jgi:hypothetical protein
MRPALSRLVTILLPAASPNTVSCPVAEEKVEVVAIVWSSFKRVEPLATMLRGNRDDRLDASLEMAMIVLKMRSRFPDGDMSPPPVSERTLNIRGA